MRPIRSVAGVSNLGSPVDRPSLALAPRAATKSSPPESIILDKDGSMTFRLGQNVSASDTERSSPNELAGHLPLERDTGAILLKTVSPPGSAPTATAASSPARFGTREVRTTSLAASELPAKSDPTPFLDVRFLVVDDSEVIRKLLDLMLTRWGGHVDCAEDGVAGYEKASVAHSRGLPYDLMLLDMSMPRMDGYDTARKLRREGYCGRIVALTAHALAGDREKCMLAGCDSYLTKPVDRTEFRRVVLMELQRRSSCGVCTRAAQMPGTAAAS
jgi:CheY-like chemotaxis protein